MIHVDEDKKTGYLMCYAPFSKEEADAINDYQMNSSYPYVCRKCESIILAKKEGMFCLEGHEPIRALAFNTWERDEA